MQAICSLEPSEPLVVFAKMKQECLWGEDASVQSPDMGDVLLHETAVAWF